MFLTQRFVAQRILFVFSTVALTVILAACSVGGLGGSPTATPNPTATPTPTPSPTPSPTPNPVAKMFTGDGYTINYPTDWKEESVPPASVVFRDALNTNTLTVTVQPNNGGITSPLALIDAILQGAVQQNGVTSTSSASVPAQVNVGGKTWDQKGMTGTVTKVGGSVQVELVVLAVIYPTNSTSSRVYEITYFGPLLSGQLIDGPLFQAMLASYKFTA